MLIATFHNIQETIIKNIRCASSDIKIAVAWFTNKEILGEIVEKLNTGIKCTVLISDDIINHRLNLQALNTRSGELKIIPTIENKFLHEKFAIIDNRFLINGSYNYTYNAEFNNFESVVLTDDVKLILQYNIRFKNIYNSAKAYEQRNLVSKLSDGIIVSEGMLEKREQDLKEELLQSLTECKKLGLDLNYTGIYELIEKYGAIGTPKRLIATGIHNIPIRFRETGFASTIGFNL